MTNYLLSCECGKTVPVEVRQAGERISCDCGATLDVPPLRKLRHLPVAAPVAGEAAGAWSPRLGIVTACLIVAAILAIVALWNRFSEPVVAPFDTRARERFVEDGLKKMTPVQAWRSWIESYRPLAEHGFSVYQNPMTAAIEAEVARRRFLQKTLLVVAAILAAIAILAAFLPRASARRR